MGEDADLATRKGFGVAAGRQMVASQNFQLFMYMIEESLAKLSPDVSGEQNL